MNYYVIKNDELYHYGVKGMKWHKHLHSRDKNVIDGVANASKGNPIGYIRGQHSLGLGKNSYIPRPYLKTYNNALTSRKGGHPARQTQYGAWWVNFDGRHQHNRKGKAAEEHKSKNSVSKAIDSGKKWLQKLFKKD